MKMDGLYDISHTELWLITPPFTKKRYIFAGSEDKAGKHAKELCLPNDKHPEYCVSPYHVPENSTIDMNII